jgi:hypothetical protein
MWKSVLGVFVLAACATTGSSAGDAVTVRKSGISAPQKPAGCALEILQKPPSRPYQSLGEIESHVTRVPPAGAVSVVTPKACELGADAIIVDRNMVLNVVGHVLVSVTAIRWAGEAPAPSASPPAPAASPAPPAAAVPPETAAPSAPPASASPVPPHETAAPAGTTGPTEPLNPREPKR